MPSTKASPAPTYTIFVDGKIERGTARELMERIRADAAKRSETIAKMDTRRYASAIVEEAVGQFEKSDGSARAGRPCHEHAAGDTGVPPVPGNAN